MSNFDENVSMLDMAQDKSQGELSGALKQLGYVSSQVFKF